MNKEEREKRIEELEAILKPPAYQPTEQEHQIAWLKYCLDKTMWVLMGIWMIRDPEMAEYNKEMVTRKDIGERFTLEFQLKNIDAIIKKWEEVGKENKNADYYEANWPYEEFKKTYTAWLNEEHFGDCVYVPCTCCRCLAEDLYGIPSTLSRCDESSKLFHELDNLRKEGREEKEGVEK